MNMNRTINPMCEGEEHQNLNLKSEVFPTSQVNVLEEKDNAFFFSGQFCGYY